MKILQISNKVPYPPKDGGSIATFNLTKGFAELGHNVSLLSINTRKHYVDIQKVNNEIKDIAKLYACYLNTNISAIQAFKNFIFSSFPYNAQRFISKTFEDKIIEILATESFDIVQLEGLYLIPYIEIIRKKSKALIAYRAHNIEHEIWQRTAIGEKNFAKQFYIKNLAKRIEKFEKASLNTYDLLIPITARDAKILAQMGNKKPVHVCPTGYDLKTLIERQNTDNQLNEISLFHIGALDWTPNQEGLLWFLKHCWKKLRQLHPALKFTVAGRNCPQWLSEKFISEGVIYKGEVENAIDFINYQRVMIAPILSGSGMRIKIIEGMALAKTIITTTIGTEGIDTTHNINILIANSPQDFLNEIIEIIENPEKINEIERNARIFIEQNFDNKIISANLLNFYNKNLGRQ